MADQDGIFIQSIEIDGGGNSFLDLSYLTEITLVETLDLSGPMLIASFRDPDSILRDDMGLKRGETIKVTFDDYWSNPDDSGAEFSDRFTVLTMPEKSEEADMVTINCLQADVWAAKAPAVTPRLFAGLAPSTIAKKLMPNLEYKFDGFAVGQAYHVLAGERSTKALRQMAMEYGAKIFYQRGVLHMKKASEMLKASPAATYASNKMGAERVIVHYRRSNTDVLVDDRLIRRYCGWDMIQGMVWSRRHADKPAQFVSSTSVAALDNLSRVDYPEVDFVVPGNGAIRPGIRLDLEWHLDRVDAPVSESLPDSIIVGTAAHYYRAQKYFTRVKGVLP